LLVPVGRAAGAAVAVNAAADNAAADADPDAGLAGTRPAPLAFAPGVVAVREGGPLLATAPRWHFLPACLGCLRHPSLRPALPCPALLALVLLVLVLAHGVLSPASGAEARVGKGPHRKTTIAAATMI
jgi:hypothetical protein